MDVKWPFFKVTSLYTSGIQFANEKNYRGTGRLDIEQKLLFFREGGTETQGLPSCAAL